MSLPSSMTLCYDRSLTGGELAQFLEIVRPLAVEIWQKSTTQHRSASGDSERQRLLGEVINSLANMYRLSSPAMDHMLRYWYTNQGLDALANAVKEGLSDQYAQYKDVISAAIQEVKNERERERNRREIREKEKREKREKRERRERMRNSTTLQKIKPKKIQKTI